MWRGRARTPLNADTVFNGYIAANVLYALDGLGLLDALDGDVEIDRFCRERDLDPRVVDALLAAAVDVGHVDRQSSGAWLTPEGQEARMVVGFMTWGVGGYHDIFAHAADVARGRRSFRRDLDRNEGEVARGSAQAGRALMADTLDEVMARVEFTALVDLGSGTCDRLCRFVGANAGTRGLGLDLSVPATRLAVQSVQDRGLADRVAPVQADVLDVLFRGAHRDRCADVDVVMSFMFLHDLLAEESTRAEVVPALRDAFPRAHTFLIADTTIRPRTEGVGTLPIFSTGFELAHALMGVPLHTREAYERLFEQGALEIKEVIDFGAPHTYLFVLEAR